MIEVLLLSFGLAMDAFAVSLVRGSVGERRLVRAVELGLVFGLAQGLMPLLGWGFGMAFAGAFEAFGHWVAFGLLVLLGGRMLWEAASDEEQAVPDGHSRFLTLTVAAFATSVDAAAAGVALPLLGVPIAVSCLTIGVVTAILCTVGYRLGALVSPRHRTVAEVVGGVVLIGLGIRILIGHTIA